MRQSYLASVSGAQDIEVPQVLQVENVSYDVREMLADDEAQLSAAMAILRQTHQNSQLQKSDYVPLQ